MVMASALSDARTYRATFTEALLELWKRRSVGPACTTPDLAPDLLRESISANLKPQELGPTEGLPKVVIPYYGKICLESFAAENGLIVFFNASENAVAAVIKMNGQSIKASLPIDSKDIVPYKISREKYSVDILRADGVQLASDNLDLTRDPVSFENIGIPQSAELGSAYLQAASLVAAAGMPREEEIAFSRRSYASFLAAGDEESARKMATRYLTTMVTDKDWEVASALANEKTAGAGLAPDLSETPLEKRIKSEGGVGSLARAEKLSGSFAKASIYYEQIAEFPAEQHNRLKFAMQAYFSAGASGDAKKAEQIRLGYSPISAALQKECADCLGKEQAAVAAVDRDPKAVGDFRSVCTIHLLSRLDY